MRIVEILFYDANKVKLVVEMPDPDRCTTESAPHVPRGLFRLFPHLAHHKCHNGNGYSFRREAMATEVPHLLEHLIMELQSQALPHNVLKGETQWNWRVDPRGTFHVHVEYENEQLVLASIRLAERIVNCLDGGEIEAIDTEQEMSGSASLRRWVRTCAPGPWSISPPACGSARRRWREPRAAAPSPAPPAAAWRRKPKPPEIA